MDSAGYTTKVSQIVARSSMYVCLPREEGETQKWDAYTELNHTFKKSLREEADNKKHRVHFLCLKTVICKKIPLSTTLVVVPYRAGAYQRAKVHGSSPICNHGSPIDDAQMTSSKSEFHFRSFLLFLSFFHRFFGTGWRAVSRVSKCVSLHNCCEPCSMIPSFVQPF